MSECFWCHSEFTPYRASGAYTQKYCSKECTRLSKNATWRKNYSSVVAEEKPCKLCGKSYTPTGNNTSYCSKICASRASYKAKIATPEKKRKTLESSNKWLKARKEQRWAKILELHSNKCNNCNETYPRCVYDLHHTELGVKKSRRDQSAQIIHEGSDEEFAQLLTITQLLCSNCHRILHNNGKVYGKV